MAVDGTWNGRNVLFLGSILERNDCELSNWQGTQVEESDDRDEKQDRNFVHSQVNVEHENNGDSREVDQIHPVRQ